MSSLLANSDVLRADHRPETIIDRCDEYRAIANTLTGELAPNLTISGDRGLGKTLVTRAALDLLDDVHTCYLSGIENDTQYQVLQELHSTLDDAAVSDGFHTAQLQDELADRLADKSVVIVIDEIDFLLGNDGSDLLYYLSRLETPERLQVITISANYSDLSAELDDRVHSTLAPRTLEFEPYRMKAVYRILADRARNAFRREPFPTEALSYMAAKVDNIRFGLCWLAEAANATDDQLTEAIVREIRAQACDRYRDMLLQSFTPHHGRLIEALCELGGDEEPVRSGAVYDRYQELCDRTDADSHTNRRMSDFLDHLELLGLIDVSRQYGGKEGKTRKITLEEF